MADPGIIERGLDALRWNRPNVLRKVDHAVRNLDAERETARRRHDQIFDAARDLERGVDNTRRELVTAAEEHGSSVEQYIGGAFGRFSATVAGVVDGLRDAKARGTTRTLEDALRNADQVMPAARADWERGAASAETMLTTARASLVKLQATTAPGNGRPKLHEGSTAPSRAKPSEGAKDTLRAGRTPWPRRKIAVDRFRMR